MQKNPRQILAANSHGKFLQQIPTANSCDKFPRQISNANSQICNTEDRVEQPLCGRASRVKIKRKQVANKAKAMRINLIN